MKEHILLVGGGGYIGTVLTEYLLSKKYYVRCFDNFIYDHGACISRFMDNNKYEFIDGDIIDSKNFSSALEDINSVVLLAGLVGDPITNKYPKESIQINDLGIKNVINICAKKNLNQLIFISTCSNYGLIKINDKANENYKLNPLSLYAKSKVSVENFIRSYQGNTDMNPTILRFATAFGLSPRMRFDLTISEFTRQLALENELLVYDAHTWRPYCHVKDFARLIHKVIEAPSEKVSFQTFNAGGDTNNSTKQMIVDTILNNLGKGKVKYKKYGGDPRNYRVDFKKVNTVLNFEPKYLINDGINELLAALNNRLFDDIETNRNFYGNYEIV